VSVSCSASKMPAKPRTTAAEKVVIMRNIVVEGKCAWNLKELEKAGSSKGVVTQAIKDVVQSLVDENLIEQDKIGSGSFFWSFASKNQLKAEAKLKASKEELEQLAKERTELQARLAAAAVTRVAPVRTR
jgi:hypothetical protein